MRLLAAILLLLAAAIAARADVTIDQLTAGAALTGTERLPMFQTANPAVTTTPSAISTYLHITQPATVFSIDGNGNLIANSVTLVPSGGNAVLNLNSPNIQQSSVLFQTAGVNFWQIGKQTDNSFFLFDVVANRNIITAAANGVPNFPFGLISGANVIATSSVFGNTANVQTTGQTGFDMSLLGATNNQFFIYDSPTSATIRPQTLRVQRAAAYTGGTPGNVDNAIWAFHTVGSGVANYEFSILGQLQNSATAGQNAAGYFQGKKMATNVGPTFGSVSEVIENVAGANPAQGTVAQELDVRGSGTDTSKNRVFSHAVLSKQNVGDTSPTAGYGYWLDPGTNNTVTNGFVVNSGTVTVGFSVQSPGACGSFCFQSPGFSVDPAGNMTVLSCTGCGAGGGGTGTVSSSTAGRLTWYAATGTTVTGNAGLTTDASGNLTIATLTSKPTPATSASNPATTRAMNARFDDYGVNIKDYGAIGDNNSHTLGSIYPNLAAAQVDFPDANDLTPEIDTMAIQRAIDVCANNYIVSNGTCRRIVCPQGDYRISQPIFLDYRGNIRGTQTTWNAGTAYTANVSKVFWNGVPWIALDNNTGNAPSESGTHWRVVGATTVRSGNSWSPAFDGGFGLKGGDPPSGCALNTTFDDDPVFWMLGNGVSVRGVNITAPVSGTRWTCSQSTRGIGFALAGGGTRAKLENVGVNGFYTGMKTSADGDDNTNDLTELTKSSIINNCISVWFSGTQNFMDQMNDDEIRGHIGVLANQNTGVNIVGGNYSGIGLAGGNQAPQNSFSMSFPASCGGNAAGCVTTASNQFQIIVALGGGSVNPIASDPWLNNTQCVPNRPGDPLSTLNPALYPATINGNPPGSNPGGWDGCVYNAWAYVSPHYGVIPLTLNAYNQATKTATFAIYSHYLWLESSSWGGQQCGGAGDCSLLEELQNHISGGTVYAAELQTTFWGCGITADGIHVENPRTATTLIKSGCGFGNGRPSTIRQPYLNYDPSMLTYIGTSLPHFYIMQGFPFIDMSDGITNDLILDQVDHQPGGNQNNNPDANTIAVYNDNVYVDMLSDGGGAGVGNGHLIWRGRAIPINFRVSPPNNSGTDFTADNQGWTSFLGGGYFDDASAATWNNDIRGIMAFYTNGIQRSPFYGVRPAPWSTPCLATSQLTQLTGALPTGLESIGGWPLLYGGQIYRKCGFGMAPQSTYQAVSSHYGWTFGRALTTTDFPGMVWNIQMRSPMAYFNSTNGGLGDMRNPITMMFPGLVATFANGCSSYVSTNPMPGFTNNPFVMITEVHLFLKYVVMTEIRLPEASASLGHNHGPPTQNTCSGTQVEQQPFAIQQF